MSLFTLDFTKDVQRARLTLSSAGHPITMQSFVPKTGATHPSVVALHGSGGIREGWAEGPAALLASRGFAVFVLHYFERTGTMWADEPTIRQNFPAWMQTVSDAITFATEQPAVGQNIGLLGFSLGGYLALAVATRDPRIKAVVEYFGGLPQELEQRAQSMPPVLILHGDADLTVPVREAERLQQVLGRAGSPFEVKIYPGAGHGFSGFNLLDAGQRTVKFLEKYLK